MFKSKVESVWTFLNLALLIGTLVAFIPAIHWVLSDCASERDRQAEQIRSLVAAGEELAKGNHKLLQPLLASLPGPALFSSIELTGKTGRLLEIQFTGARELPAWLSGILASPSMELPLDTKNALSIRLIPEPGYIGQRLAAAISFVLVTALLMAVILNATLWKLRGSSVPVIDKRRWRDALSPAVETEPSEVFAPQAPESGMPAALLDSLPEALLRCDGDWRVVYLNAAASAMLGIPAGGQYPKLIELIAPWERNRFSETLALLAETRGKPLEVQLLTPHGAIITATLAFASLPRDGGGFLTLRDASAVREQREALALYNLLLDTLPQGLAVLSSVPEGEILYCNNSFRSLLSIGLKDGFLPGSLAAHMRDRVYSLPQNVSSQGVHFVWDEMKGRILEWQVYSTLLDGRPHFACIAMDRSEETRTHRRLERELARYLKILEAMPLGLCIADSQGEVRFANAQLSKLSGYPQGEVLNAPIAKWLPRDGRNQGLAYQGEVAFGNEQNERIAKVNTLVLAVSSDSVEYGYFFDDITAYKQKSIQDAVERKRLHRVLDSIAVGVITTNPDGFIQYLNPYAQQLTGLSEERSKGMPFGQAIHLIDEKKREPLADPAVRALRIGKAITLRQDVLLVEENQPDLPVEISATPLSEGGQALSGCVILMRDVSEQRSLAQQMNIRASRDPLTGLINRRELLSLLENLQLDVERSNKQHSLCYMDLDKFKAINDTCGHQAGDELLRQVAQLMGECLRSNDILARIGGDEFCTILRNATPENAAKVAEKIREAINGFRFAWGGKYFEIGISIGVVGLCPGASIEETLSNADQACYVAKEKGRDCVYIYRGGEEKGKPALTPWKERLSTAIEHDYFRLYWQSARYLPSETGPVIGYHEIMPQMHEPGHAPLSASAYMPNAQRLNLTSTIERWIIGKLFASIRVNAREQVNTVEVYAIPVSASTLWEASFSSFLNDQCQQYGIPPSLICFEITEDDMVHNYSLVQKVMQEQRQSGFRFSLNQFGGGISSFAYIRNLPVEFLKIDISLTREVETNPIDAAIVRAILAICNQLHINTIAQQVDTQSKLEFLDSLGLHYVQGPIVEDPKPMRPA